MKTARSAGRPVKGSANISRGDILAQALQLMDEAGERGLTMRSLAKRMSISPMALYHHVGNRDELIAALIENVFGGIQDTIDNKSAPLDRVEVLLSVYCVKAAAHPELVLCVFRDTEAFKGTLSRLTDQLCVDLRQLGLSAGEVPRWIGLLVDYTHGFAISEASRKRPACAEAVPVYQHNLKFLMGVLRSWQ